MHQTQTEFSYQENTYNQGHPFPTTRYQGSKLRLLSWIWESLQGLEFNSALDAFGGTGCVSHFLKSKGKQVTYNDCLHFNYLIGLALVENNNEFLMQQDLDYILKRHDDMQYPTFIEDTFSDIYFTDAENAWLDKIVTNIRTMENPYKRALAYFALFQACIIKRPYNLFHRKNLYIRTANVERTFGNKTTWDTSFENHFLRFAEAANRAVFNNGQHNIAFNKDVFDVAGEFDLVYIDTPYLNAKGIGVNYHSFYHFLEGLVNYDNWQHLIDHKRKTKEMIAAKSIWTDKNEISSAFDTLFQKFRDSTLVVSYRSNGIPGDQELIKLLKRYKKRVWEIERKDYQYVLSTTKSQELLLIATND